MRLDRYLAEQMSASYSRAVVQRAIREGQVTVGGAVAKPHRRLKPGEQVVAHLQEVSDTFDPKSVRHFLAEPISLEVVHEDADVLVVNKPPHLVTHPAPGHPSGTLVNAVAWHLTKGQGAGDKGHALLPRAGIVHRLDKDTSGLLVVAKTEPALRELGRQLRARTMSRRYVALVEGHVPLNEGTVDVGVGRHLTHRKEMAVRYLGGRHAVTHYRVLKRSEMGQGAGDKGQASQSLTSPVPRPPSLKYSVLELQLETGRTHQIRVHMSHLGHPVLGDLTYSRHPEAFWRARGITRQLLHAYAITFAHPSTARPVELRIGLPEDMMRWMGRPS